jgi:tRNA1(Val) A37 N6-methylase TrmN6
MTEAAADITEDAFLGGQLLLKQKRSGHRAGHDAILLAAATEAHAGDNVVDLGAGIGTAGLALARRVAGIKLSLVEIDPRQRLCSTSRPMRRTLPHMGSCPTASIMC